MIFTETPLSGAFIVAPEFRNDKRGFFARTWCKEEFALQHLDTRLVQCNISFNRLQGTLRGLHYQSFPYPETKLVRCTMGAIYDVIVDLRVESATYKKWFGTELSASNRRSLYVPAGFAHGFLTLVNETEVFYQMSEFHHPEFSRGVRWNDPSVAICWPEYPHVISDIDQQYPDLGI